MDTDFGYNFKVFLVSGVAHKLSKKAAINQRLCQSLETYLQTLQ